MDLLWTFETPTLHLSHTKNENCGLKKMSNVFLKMKNLSVKCIETFLIYIF
jgi:hypothetical protein